MTRQQKKAVRKALRQYGRKQKAADAAGCAAAGPDPWGRVIRQALDYYAEVDGTCADLLRLRYLEERPEAETINNVRFVVSSEAKVWKGDGCPAGLAVYSTLVLGAHAYATTELEGGGMQHIVKQLGYGDDPLNQRASVGWKATKTAERLSEQYMVRIESCSARYSAKALAN